MAKTEKYNNRAATTNETGFGTNSSYSGGRFYKKDGTPNVTVTGVNAFKKFSLYKAMLNVSTLQFLLIIVLFYLAVNLFFAFIYLLIGIEHLGGIDKGSPLEKFWQAFFFSAQTLSTVGYGHIFPKSLLANTIAAGESVLGLLILALGTGMMYGRFSKPRAFIRYSHNALFAPYKNGSAIMFRLAAYKHNHLMDSEVKVTLVLKVDEDGILVNKFFTLPLEISKVNSLTLSWTLVHAITKNSPFYGLNKEDLIAAQAELLVYLKAFDESFSNTVISRTSYTAEEFVYGAKFRLMYNPNEEHDTTILNISKLNDHDLHELPEFVEVEAETADY